MTRASRTPAIDAISRRRVVGAGLAAAAALSLPPLARARPGPNAVAWRAYGAGSHSLIFVHGWTCDATSWAAQTPEFAQRCRVMTLDLPGHGHSAPPAGEPWSIALFARAVERARAAAGVKRAVLVGHSMGALVVRQYALDYPEHTEGLVLADGLVPSPSPGAAPNLTGPEGLVARTRMVEGMFRPETPPAVRRRVRRVMLGTSEATAQGAMNATRGLPWRADPVTVPVAVIDAEGSHRATPEAFRALYPNMTYQQIAGTAHFLMMERPAAFNAALEAYLRSIGWPATTSRP